MSNFWANPDMEPKRSFLFKLEIGNLDHWLALSTDRPSFEIGSVPVNYLNVEFNYVGRIKWTPITCTIRESINTNSLDLIKSILVKSGYTLMESGTAISGDNFKESVSRKKAILALSDASNGKGVRISQLDAQGNSIDSWVLENAWISKAEFSTLSYDEEKVNEVKLTIVYDYATVETKKFA